MLILKRGDRLPTVAVVQSHLNEELDGPPLVIDGVFGPKTYEAVKRFQASLRWPQTGVVEYRLWNKLVGDKWQVVDSVDRTDFDRPKHAINDHEDLTPYGQTVLEQFGMTAGGRLVIGSIVRAARSGAVVLLRFHGHGSPGTMIVSSGGRVNSTFHSKFPLEFDQALERMSPIFAPFGSIEFHGCRVGLGAEGRRLLARVADATGVPATGALNTQYGGGKSTFRFEGKTETIAPDSKKLEQWAKATFIASFMAPA
jgi:hypothetical protein